MGQKRYANGFELTLHPEALNEPKKVKEPSMFFVCSMADLFHDDVPFEFIDKVLKTIGECPQHTFQLQDISEEDCLKEGIYVSDTFTKYGIRNGYSPQCANDPKEKKWWFNSPREAFSHLIDKVSGKGTWDLNPWNFAYEFELVK